MVARVEEWGGVLKGGSVGVSNGVNGVVWSDIVVAGWGELIYS